MQKSLKAKKEDSQDDVDPCDEILETIRCVIIDCFSATIDFSWSFCVCLPCMFMCS
jgi:hypothetical protein